MRAISYGSGSGLFERRDECARPVPRRERTELDGLLSALPLYEWMTVTVTGLERHPNDPAAGGMSDHLPEPQLSLVYRLEARLGEPLDLGETALGRRRIVPLTAGTFSGPEISGRLLPGASADWQTVLPDGDRAGGHPLHAADRRRRSALRPIARRPPRQPRRPRPPRPGRGRRRRRVHLPHHHPDRDRRPQLDWLNKGMFIAVGARQPAGVIYETYLVG